MLRNRMVKKCFGADMSSFRINGGKPLFGRVEVNGSKNAALPMIFSAIISNGISEISNFPFIGDTETAIEIISSLGAKCHKNGKTLYIDTRDLTYTAPDPALVGKIRASTYLIGACLSRFGRVDLARSGGCDFAYRPIDLHIFASEAFGAELTGNSLTVKKLTAADLTLPKPSVGATVNSLILAASAKGVSTIRGCALEPHVLALADFLVSMGASINFYGNTARVVGADLSGGKSRVIGDMIEAATYLLSGVATGGEVETFGIDPKSLSSFLNLLSDMGADIKITHESVKMQAKSKLKFAKAVAKPYPGLPTDIQPLLAPIFAMNSGGVISDEVFPERFGYLDTLSDFGIKWSKNGGEALILPSDIRPSRSYAKDLRGGAACLITALGANGESIIDRAEIIERGYEAPDRILRSLHADAVIK